MCFTKKFHLVFCLIVLVDVVQHDDAAEPDCAPAGPAQRVPRLPQRQPRSGNRGQATWKGEEWRKINNEIMLEVDFLADDLTLTLMLVPK